MTATLNAHATAESFTDGWFHSGDPGAFEVPKRIFFLSHLPRTEKGTGDRRQLAELLA